MTPHRCWGCGSTSVPRCGSLCADCSWEEHLAGIAHTGEFDYAHENTPPCCRVTFDAVADLRRVRDVLNHEFTGAPIDGVGQLEERVRMRCDKLGVRVGEIAVEPGPLGWQVDVRLLPESDEITISVVKV